jgi:UDP-GlcNAc:undecaprenyl-phosphate GlcNAc-1-phosphate transferase
MTTYTAVFALAALVAVGLTPVLIWLAHRLGLVDAPGLRKVHKTEVPRIGGLAIVAATLAATVPVLFLNNAIGSAMRGHGWQIVMFYAAATLIFLMGFLDDLRGLRARTKLLVQLVAATGCFAAGIRIESLALFELGTIDIGWLSFPLTMLWIIGITNAINLIDGLDGLAAGVGAITCAMLAMFSVYQHDPVMAVITLGLLGSLVGFLYFNFNPARIFMGDSGSQFVGFALSTAAVMTYNKATTAVALTLPVLALGVPIFDTLLAMLRRFLGRRSLFGPDRGHIHHRLLERGLDHRKTVLLIYGVTATASGFGVIMTVHRDSRTLFLFMVALVFLLFAFRFAGVFRVRGTMRKIQENSRLARKARADRRQFEEAMLRVAEADSFEAWWAAVSNAGETLGFAQLTLRYEDRRGSMQTKEWLNLELPRTTEGLIHVSVPLKDRRARSALSLEGCVHCEDTLEGAGQRVTLLARLLDESGFFPPRMAPEAVAARPPVEASAWVEMDAPEAARARVSAG